MPRWTLIAGGAVLVVAAIFALRGGGADTDSHDRVGARGGLVPKKKVLAEGDRIFAGDRVLDVVVDGCRGPAVGALVFAHVGKQLFTAESDESGRAHLQIASEDEVTVTARVGTYESEPVGWEDEGEAVAVKVCPPGRVSGVVRWDYGGSVARATIALVDEAGTILDETETSDGGAYALVDAELSGRSLKIEASGERAERDLAALSPGEARRFDVVMGDLREVEGWVLDMQGDPVAGVTVRLGWETSGSQWSTVSDAKGAFRFEDMPATPLRVTADGGDLGMASARIAQADGARREVTLVLEPVGAILVTIAPKLRAALGDTEVTVVARCFSAQAHGEDGLWVDDKRTPQPEEIGEVIGEDHAIPDVDDVAPGEDLPSDGAGMDDDNAMMESMGRALLDWDPADPETGIVNVVMNMVQDNPKIRAELEKELGGESSRTSESLEDLARQLAQKTLREQPQVAAMFGAAAEHIRAGASPMEAMMAAAQAETERASNEAKEVPVPDAVEAVPAEAVAVEPAEAVAVEPAPDEVGTSSDIEMSMETPIDGQVDGGHFIDGGDGEMYYAPGAPEAIDPVFEARALLIDKIREASGASAEWASDRRAVVAEGAVGAVIPVRGAFEYQVALSHPDGIEIVCGAVFVGPGQTVEVVCGQEAEAVLVGRVVDGEGKPVVGVEVNAWIVGETSIATTDAQGRYRLAGVLNVASMTELSATDPSGARRAATRRAVQLRPGETTELEDLVMLAEDEAPVGVMTTPFGGVGGYLQLASEGILLAGLEEEGPLALAGAEAGDTIIAIGDQLGASMSMDDALMLLRGEAGTDVDVTLRNPAGELYELLVTRGIITPRVAEPTPDVEVPEIR
ncbi:MAG: carboxypeptidase regulatory-like domain-containing protein [Deltaproteobacteria bacterium]|nr:carboxypeptidase regulatory-like domain-containing protein [Deltaproteobacteria bacterium]